MKNLLEEIKQCTLCKEHLQLGPRPIVHATSKSKIIIIGQAPGLAVHNSGIPWNDKSGENLRNWLGVEKQEFYDTSKFALTPMGFCYPGKGKSGDLPPRKECAPLWHEALLQEIKSVELIILIGAYAQNYYLTNFPKTTLTKRVFEFENYLPTYFVLPHPSPRNNIWQTKNKWFATIVLPQLKKEISKILKKK
ncbi:uracil-DNA glycosylase family protein [Flavicella sediminum]|uniref:uracil-DNA glycosylase family protein n=1 Tax=Flavicella sediminum TaxID=2585141 RepID=UPI0011216043|nr:uracil-DNA glycosylase family protein [Flavicella sediminum]